MTEDWRDILSFLTSSISNKQNKCFVRLLDTIFFDFTKENEPTLLWYFTTKSGSISKKKDDSLSLKGIPERFSRFALANPNNKEEFVGTLYHGISGYRQFMKMPGLEELLSNNLAALNQKSSYLQVYLRPFKGREELLTVNISTDDASTPTVSYRMSPMLGDSSTSYQITNESSIVKQAQGFLNEFVSYVRKNQRKDVTNMSMEFIVDDNEHVWLSKISSLETSKIL